MNKKELKEKIIELGFKGKLIPEIVEELQVPREFVVEVFTEYRKKINIK